MKLVTDAISYISSALDLAGVVAVRIRLRDPSVTIVDLQFGIRIAADFARTLDSVLLGVEARRITVDTTRIASESSAMRWWSIF